MMAVPMSRCLPFMSLGIAVGVGILVGSVIGFSVGRPGTRHSVASGG